MNLLIKFSAILFLSMASSCDSAKTTAAEKETETKSISTMDSKYESEGYLSGIVKYQRDSQCSYIIVDVKTNVKFDPINIDEEKFMSFKKDAEKVYFKYQGLRMMNRCDDVQPIQIIALQPRED